MGSASVAWKYCKMTQPRHFSWFVEDKLAGMGYPKETDFPFLVETGIRRVVNLTHNEANYFEVAEANGVTVHNICVKQFCPPSLQQIQEFLDILDSSPEVDM